MTAKIVLNAASTKGSTFVANRTRIGANPNEIKPKNSRMITFRTGISVGLEWLNEFTVCGPST